MRAPVRRLQSLASPAFITALALLVVNDFALKGLFHNALTGKLSDFAGLFALTMFVATLWPRRTRIAGAAIAAAFTLWKTTLAEPLIEALNLVLPFPAGRTVDFTDLVALPMIPLAAWAASRVSVWPLPRSAQVGLALLAPIAFTATTKISYVVRSTLQVDSVAVVDEPSLQLFFDELADRHELRCRACDPIGEGRAYVGGSRKGPDTFTVNFNSEHRTMFFRVTGDGRRGVLSLSADIRAGMSERFPGIATVEFTDSPDQAPLAAAAFVIRVPAGQALSVDSVEQAKRTLSSIVEEVVRANGLRADPSSLVYYAGRRVGVGAEERDLALIQTAESNATLHVRVVSYSAGFDALRRAVASDLAARLDAAFGPGNVERRGFGQE